MKRPTRRADKSSSCLYLDWTCFRVPQHSVPVRRGILWAGGHDVRRRWVIDRGTVGRCAFSTHRGLVTAHGTSMDDAATLVSALRVPRTIMHSNGFALRQCLRVAVSLQFWRAVRCFLAHVPLYSPSRRRSQYNLWNFLPDLPPEPGPIYLSIPTARQRHGWGDSNIQAPNVRAGHTDLQ